MSADPRAATDAVTIVLGATIPLQAYLAVAALLFCTGVWGLINSRNAVRVLMSIELMLNAVNINLIDCAAR